MEGITTYDVAATSESAASECTLRKRKAPPAGYPPVFIVNIDDELPNTPARYYTSPVTPYLLTAIPNTTVYLASRRVAVMMDAALRV